MLLQHNTSVIVNAIPETSQYWNPNLHPYAVNRYAHVGYIHRGSHLRRR